MTNTKIKFVIVVDSGNIALRENEVRAVSIYPILSVCIYDLSVKCVIQYFSYTDVSKFAYALH